MVVRLRLARHGSKKNPFYHVVAISDKCPRDARPIEKLGEYDPIPRTRPAASPAQAKLQQPTGLFTSGIQPTIESTRLEKRLEWNSDRIKHWLSVGAQPSKPVARLLDRAGLVPPGKTYKGIYQPPSDPASHSSTASSAALPKTASPSVILRAAGVTGAPLSGTAASAEDHSTRPTDPAVEARRLDPGPATPSQAQ